MIKVSIIFGILLFCLPLAAQEPVRVTFVGASITAGARTGNPERNSYPAQLQDLLGDGYRVANFGVSSTTMLKNGNVPYWEKPAYRQALESEPDIVFIDLGGNDAKAVNRAYYGELTGDAREMIRSFRELPSRPRVIVLLPFVSFSTDTTGIWDPVIVGEVTPRLQRAAFEEGAEVLDMHPLLIAYPERVPDKVHPDSLGSAHAARKLYVYLNQKTEPEYDLLSMLPTYRETNFNGFLCAEFEWEGRLCRVAKPRITAPGRPWIWRARFWGHEPQTDVALLERGFHVVYCETTGLMGNAESIRIWNSFYKLLTKAGLAAKCTLEGMSRGGMYALNWAAENPEKVNAVYIDNPLLDARYLAYRPGHLSAMTRDLMEAYGLQDRESLGQFSGNPMDKTDAIARGHYPILILSADRDEAVDHTQALDFGQKIEEAGGKYTLIVKPGAAHHPHSLPDPTPIADFILEATGIGTEY